MKKCFLVALLAVVLAVAMLLTGCVSSDTATTQTPTSAPTVTDPQPTNPQPTNPQPTNPQPTNPQPTNPQPTDPTPTNPDQGGDINVESITLSAPKTTIAVMEELQITATILPENADVLTVMYNSTGGQVLDNGVFFAADPGVYVITAYAMDDSGVSSSITIIVEAAPVTGIAITGGNTVTAGNTLQLQATVSPEYATDPSITWSIVSGTEFATMDQNGLLTAIAPGNVIVQAAANDGSGVTATHTVEITPVLTSSITISGENNVTVGDTLQLQAEVNPAGSSVTWSIISGTEFATIDQNGLLTAIAPGDVTVQVAANDGSGVKGTHKVEVQPVLVSEITISGASTVEVGKTIQLSAGVKPNGAANKNVKWSISEGSSYAKISEDGVLTGVAAGNVTVKATALDGSGVYAEITITVKPEPPVSVTSVSISGAKDIYVGDTLTLTATVLPDNAANKKVTWSITSGSSYATISANGKITATKAGTITVKATAQDGSGKYATVTITIKSKALWEGSGTEYDPFLIRCLDDLLNLRNVLNKSGYYYRQVADIDCSSVGNWVVIGDDENPFRHHYDGGGYTISNLCFDGDATALFEVVRDSHFKNMNIVNAYSSDNHTTREHYTGKYPGDGGYTGAIVGYGIGCSFENCTATVDFQSSNDTTGGLIGFVVLKNEQYTLMENCHVSGTITSGGYTGGLIGQIWHYMDDDDYMPASTISVVNCSADVEINIFTISTERACVGGLIGESFGIRIEKCHAKGSITVIDGDVGGLVGYSGNYTDITRCYAQVDILANTDDQYGGISAGGLIGYMNSRNDVYDCYATGNISAPYAKWSPCQDSTPKNGGPYRKYYNPCGSLIGTLEVYRAYSEDQNITVYNCYATGMVDVPNICEDERVYCHGALIGLVLDRYTVTTVIDKTQKDQSSWDDFSENYIGHFGNNYNLEDLRTYYTPINDYEGSNINGLQRPKYTAMPTHEYVEIITEGQLLDESIFEGWDFENVWIMTEFGPQLR